MVKSNSWMGFHIQPTAGMAIDKSIDFSLAKNYIDNGIAASFHTLP